LGNVGTGFKETFDFSREIVVVKLRFIKVIEKKHLFNNYTFTMQIKINVTSNVF